MNYGDLLRAFSAETLLVLFAGVIAFADGWLARKGRAEQLRHQIASGLLLLACAGAGWSLVRVTPPCMLPDGMIVSTDVGIHLKGVILVLLSFTGLIAAGTVRTHHIGEFYILLILSAIGMFVMLSTENLLMAFVALELASIALYILAGFDKKDVRSAEAAMKYFLFGGVAAAFLLFGLSLVYGLTGSLDVRVVGRSLSHMPASPLLLTATVMVMAGFAFKIAAAPFHLWAPDAYEGAPVSVAAFVASASKVAGFALFVKLLTVGFPGTFLTRNGLWDAPSWMSLAVLLSVFSMIWGNVAALKQKSVKRLLAYSAVAHAGYMLIGVLAAPKLGSNALLYYAVTYALATVGAFGAVAAVEKSCGSDKLDAFAGLMRRSPFLAICMAAFILSLAGIPPLAGFFGKFYLFAAILKMDGSSLCRFWLAGLALATSCVSLYYYLQILKQVFVVEKEDADTIGLDTPLRWVLGLAAAGVLAAGLFPEALLRVL